MNDAQSTIVGLRHQDCPGGGWNGMPAELVNRATVADCLDHGMCGCIYGDAVRHIDRLMMILADIREKSDCPWSAYVAAGALEFDIGAT